MAERLGAGDLARAGSAALSQRRARQPDDVLNGTAASLERQRRDIEDLNDKLRQSQRLETLEKQRLDIAVDNMTQGLLLFDASERIVVCNQRYIEMYGLSPDVVKPGCSFRDLIAHRKQTRVVRGRRRRVLSATWMVWAQRAGRLSPSWRPRTDVRSSS